MELGSLTLINLGPTINVMKIDTMLNMNFQWFMRHTPMVLQLVDISTMYLEGILKDIIVTIDS
jgi:hypothetical protein